MQKDWILILLAAAAFGLTACSNNDEAEYSGNSALNEIRLSSTLAANDASTRANNEQNSGNFEASQYIDVFMYENGGSATTYSTPLTATTTASSPNLSFATSQYWPTSGNGLDIWGWYPSQSTTGVATISRTNANLSAAGTFTINEDQSATNATRLNDLMVGLAPAYPVARTSYLSARVPLSFTHLLSKIVVKLKVGTGVETALLANGTITIPSIYTVATVKKWNPSPTELTDIETNIVPKTTSGTTGNLKIATIPVSTSSDWKTDDGTYFVSTAILPPQNTAGKLLTITLSDGGVTTYAIPHNFAAGNVYTYTITINRTGITVTTSINPWPSSGDNFHAGSHEY